MAGQMRNANCNANLGTIDDLRMVEMGQNLSQNGVDYIICRTIPI
jgi:hypothetical protein